MVTGNYTLKKNADGQYLITTFTKGDNGTIETFDGTLDDFDAALFLRADAYGENVNKAMSNISKNSTTYEGGKLEFCNRSEKKNNYLSTPEPMKYRGSIVIFPSFVWHKVHPVTKGTRYSLTNWHCGNPYV